MKRACVVLIVLGLSLSAFSQTKMFINKTNGTSDSLLLSDFKSISYKSGLSVMPNDLVRVTGGTFLMGSNDATDGAFSPHSVTLNTCYIDRTEITYEKWTDVRNWGLTHGYTDLVAGRNGFHGTTDHPVTEVSWYDILKWCNARSEKDGLTPIYYTSNTFSSVYRIGQLDVAVDAVQWTANGYRLPTEAEWEFAAKGGAKSQGYPYSGSYNVDGVAWHSLNSLNNTQPVEAKGANELGLFDMSGNVWERCWDWWEKYGSDAQTNPKGPTVGTYRVLRGGSFEYDPAFSRVTSRKGPASNVEGIGFRCVRN